MLLGGSSYDRHVANIQACCTNTLLTANQKVVCFKWAGLEDELRSCTKNREKINEELRLIQSTSRRVQE